jgi:hypothetical protein
MLCSHCETLWSDLARGRRPMMPWRASGGDRLGLLYCQRCGTALPLLDTTDFLLATLSRLARFGLSAGDEPILAGQPNGHPAADPSEP